MTNLSKGGTIPKRMNKNEFEKIRGISPKVVKCVLCGEEMKLSDGIFKHECVKTELVSFENICLKSSPSECYISVFKNSSLLYGVFNFIYDESDLKRAGLLEAAEKVAQKIVN